MKPALAKFPKGVGAPARQAGGAGGWLRGPLK